MPTNQVLSPLGAQVAFGGRPTDLALSPDGRWLAVLDRAQVLTINPATGQVAARTPHKGGKATLESRLRPTASDCWRRASGGTIGVFEATPEGALNPQPPIRLTAGAVFAARARCRSLWPWPLRCATLWAVLNLNNSLAESDLATGRVRCEIRVGNAPYGVVLVRNKAYVTNWAGTRRPPIRRPGRPAWRGRWRRGSAAVHRLGWFRVGCRSGRWREQKQIVVGLRIPRP